MVVSSGFFLLARVLHWLLNTSISHQKIHWALPFAFWGLVDTGISPPSWIAHADFWHRRSGDATYQAGRQNANKIWFLDLFLMKNTYYLNPIEAWRSFWFNLPYFFAAILVGTGSCAHNFGTWADQVTGYAPRQNSYFWRCLEWVEIKHWSELYKY